MIISTCGFGSTGSSAVSDYLLECDDISLFDGVEFTLASMPDGLEDLEFHLIKQHTRFDSSIFAIYRFRNLVKDMTKIWVKNSSITKEQIKSYTDEYLDEITQIKYIGDPPEMTRKEMGVINHYLGYSLFLHRFIYRLERKKKIKKNHVYFPFREISCSIEPENFYTATKKYVKRLLEAMGCNFEKKLVLDQAFAGDNPQKSFCFFENPYAIVVDRDPRDMYIFSKEILLSRGRYMPTDKVEDFIKYYRLLRENQPYLRENPRVLRISFEALVYDYENTTKQINDFLNVKNTKKKTIFIPEQSAANTNLIRKFPKYSDDIKIIEKELPEYIFNFDEYDHIQGSNEMFYGKSPQNKQ